MDLYTTEIKAIDPKDGEMKTWGGQHVPGLSFTDAQNYCNKNGLGFCKVVGKLVAEIASDEVWDKNNDRHSVSNN